MGKVTITPETIVHVTCDRCDKRIAEDEFWYEITIQCRSRIRDYFTTEFRCLCGDCLMQLNEFMIKEVK